MNVRTRMRPCMFQFFCMENSYDYFLANCSGYMSPEYALDGNFSMKSDVFSYGVVVLEIISGQKNRGVYAHSPYLNLVAHVSHSFTLLICLE